MTILSGASNLGQIRFGDSGNSNIGGINYSHNNNEMNFITGGTGRMSITSDGDLNFASGQLQLLADNSAATTTAKWDRGLDKVKYLYSFTILSWWKCKRKYWL